MFGEEFVTGRGERIPGLGILPVVTHAPTDLVKDRSIGNILIETQLPIHPKTLVGFENHSGQTQAALEHYSELGKVILGKGNSSEGILEGCRYRNVFGTYMHGPLLPKNAHFADYLLSLAFQRKYKQELVVSKIDGLELQAHETMVNRLTNTY